MDDDADDQQLLCDAFHSIDDRYQVLTALDGEEGLQKLHVLKQENNLPSLIVLDINMPRMDGRETFSRLQEEELISQIPIAVFSTSAAPGDRSFFERGNVHYITKPLTFSLFKQVAETLLQLCRAGRYVDAEIALK